jgi:hypothetical protein
MADYPIIFSAPMVRALLDGRKTMTRRLAWHSNKKTGAAYVEKARRSLWQKATPGDRLWVRENFARVPASAYRMSDGVQQTIDPTDRDFAAIYAAGWERSAPKWKPSIHMPRWASRLTLVVTAVKMERLQEISEGDAIAEGIEWIPELDPVGPCKWRVYTQPHAGTSSPVASFESLWASLHGDGAWNQNPEVVALSFTVHATNIDRMKEAAP